MNYRRYFRHVMMLTLATGLLASCSKDNTPGEPDSDTNTNELVAITPEVSFTTSNSLSETYSPTGPVDGTEDLTLYFIKGEQNPAMPTMFTYGAEQIAANRPADEGDVTPEDPADPYYEPLTFETTMYYPIDGSNVRLWGWYPKADSYSMGTAMWTFDGNDDLIMASGKTGNNKMTSPLQFEFEHILTQVQFIIHTESELAADYWGNVTSISLRSENNTCTFMVAYGDNYIAMGQSFKSALMLLPSGNATMSIKGSMAISNENQEVLEADESKRISCLFGNLIITPRTTPTSLTVYVTTSKHETTEFPISIESHTYNAGEATRVYLNFLPGEIISTLTAGEWEPVNVNVELGEYPYVRNGKYIVTKDLLGYSGEPLHENWSPEPTPYHTASSEDNRVSAILEIAEQNTEKETQNWYEATGMTDKTHNSGATSLCPEGWRLPTIKELELIYNQNDRLSEEFRLTPTAMYWSSTTSDKNEDFAHIFEVSIDEDRQANKHKTDAGENYKVRCVRDI